jgi:hypothetical protein
MMNTYLETNDQRFAIQLSNFASKIGTYSETFGFSAAEVDSMVDDAAFFAWTVTNFKKVETFKKNWTTFKSILKKGEANVTINSYTDFPVLETMPKAVAPGVLVRFTTMVNRLKAHQNYTTAIGQNLGVELTASQKLDLDAAQPILKVVVRGGRVNLDWKKGKFDGILIEKDSGNGFLVLDKDMHPNFIDNSPLPPVGESAIWRYRAMYLLSDDRVGIWSDIVTTSVTA